MIKVGPRACIAPRARLSYHLRVVVPSSRTRRRRVYLSSVTLAATASKREREKQGRRRHGCTSVHTLDVVAARLLHLWSLYSRVSTSAASSRCARFSEKWVRQVISLNYNNIHLIFLWYFMSTTERFYFQMDEKKVFHHKMLINGSTRVVSNTFDADK